MFKAIALAFVILSGTAIHAHAGVKANLVEALDGGSASDNDMVHGLAHMQAGAYAAIPAQVAMSWLHAPWYASILADTIVAASVTALYETETNKSSVTAWQHIGDGAAGGLEVASISISMRW